MVVLELFSALICFHLCSPISLFSMSPASYPAGENTVTISCGENLKESSILTYELLENKNGDWTSVFKANDSLMYRVNEDTTFDDFSISSFSGTCKSWCYAVFKAIVQSDTCMMGHYAFLKARCGIVQENKTIYSSDINIFSVKGESPKYIHSISIVDERFSIDRSKTMYEMDDVLQLQCVGEIENVNSRPTKDIRWCKKIVGTFKVMSLQEPPLTEIFSRSKNGCVVVQKSVIFYHVSQYDTLLDIMCESGYSDYGNECGERGINIPFRIPITYIKTEEWRMSPIILYDKHSMLNTKRIELEGAGKLINLICTASIISKSTSFTKYVNWCIKNKKEAKWKKVTLQEWDEKATLISKGKITFFSKLQYHVTVFDNDVHFLCEISKSPKCGTGFTSIQTSIHIDKEKGMQQQMFDEHEYSTAAVAALSGILTFTIILNILLIVVLLRRREINLFGWMIRIDRIRCKEETTTKGRTGNAPLPEILEVKTNENTKSTEKSSSNFNQKKDRPVKLEADVTQEEKLTDDQRDGYLSFLPVDSQANYATVL